MHELLSSTELGICNNGGNGGGFGKEQKMAWFGDEYSAPQLFLSHLPSPLFSSMHLQPHRLSTELLTCVLNRA